MAVSTTGAIESRLWEVADELRANSKLKSSEYATPVLGLIFLVYADHRFSEAEKHIEGADKSKRRKPGKVDYQAQGVLYLPESARLNTLLNLPEGVNLGANINEAMKAIEEENPDLKGVLPRNYNRLENKTLIELLKAVSSIPQDIEGDRFGKIYEYFLGHFAMAEGQKGGEFFTPTSLVRLIVEIIEPFHGRIFDPACGSGGMFVQSARFIQEHQQKPSPLAPLPGGEGDGDEGAQFGRGARGEGGPKGVLSIFGQERVAETVRLCKMNLAVHGLSGDIREENTYYNDLHKAATKKGQPGRFDFVMANPPFNVDKVDKDRLEDDPRFPFGLPKPDNANYLWIQTFYSALNEQGRAGFVMANSASDARGTEMEIRRQLIEAHVVDVMIAIGSNFFYTVTLPCTLWFFDRAKTALPCSPTGAPEALPPSPLAPLPVGEGNGERVRSLGEGNGERVRSLENGSKINYRGGFDYAGLVKKARELRKKNTPAEELLWGMLRNRQFMDLKFRRQHQIGEYIVDFYCHEHKLIIELDGPVHDDPKQKKHDTKRDKYLHSLGNTVLRIKNEVVLKTPEKALGTIATKLPTPDDNEANSPSPPGRGGGEGAAHKRGGGEGAAHRRGGGEGAAHRRGGGEGAPRKKDTVLFIDARSIFTQIDRAHRDFTPEQIEFIANIARLYRGEKPENGDCTKRAKRDGTVPAFQAERSGSGAVPASEQAQQKGAGAVPDFSELFPKGKYADVPGLCKVATIDEIEAQGWSLNPGRYVGVAEREEDDFDFKERLEELNEELEALNHEARELEAQIAENVASLLEGE